MKDRFAFMSGNQELKWKLLPLKEPTFLGGGVEKKVINDRNILSKYVLELKGKGLLHILIIV